MHNATLLIVIFKAVLMDEDGKRSFDHLIYQKIW